MKLKNEQIVGIAGLLGIAYYVFFCNKEGASAGADTSGGGGGGGGFGGGGFAPASLVVLNTPTTTTTSKASTMPTVSAAVSTGLKSNEPIAASTSSTSVGAQSGVGVSNTGGITGIGSGGARPSGLGSGTPIGTGGIVPINQGGSPTPVSTGTVSAADMKTGLSGGAVFKPFSGKGVLTLDNLLM
jgi:hypothetical protein